MTSSVAIIKFKKYLRMYRVLAIYNLKCFNQNSSDMELLPMWYAGMSSISELFWIALSRVEFVEILLNTSKQMTTD